MRYYHYPLFIDEEAKVLGNLAHVTCLAYSETVS